MRRADVQRAVFRWSATRQRPLPWRGERDPYRVLVSEVMLQQTQAARVAPVYERFVSRFPTVDALARSPADDVLRAWENLGYNRRALNLWRTADAVAERGGFPTSVTELQALPGLGAYTARAVASFAFGADVGVVDANVRRVLARMHGLRTSTGVQSIADEMVPRGRSPAWNQAMIDLGAEVCRARAPRCDRCPMSSACAWHRGVRPEPAPRASEPKFEHTTRYARGRVMQVLRGDGPVGHRALIRTSGLSSERAEAAIESLIADGLVHARAGRVGLGPGPTAPGRATRARR